MAGRVRRDRQPFCRTATLNLHCQKVLFSLHHTSHHRGTGEQSAKRRRDHGARLMMHPCILRHLTRRDGKRPYLTLCRRRPDNIISHFNLPYHSCRHFPVYSSASFFFPLSCAIKQIRPLFSPAGSRVNASYAPTNFIPAAVSRRLIASGEYARW